MKIDSGMEPSIYYVSIIFHFLNHPLTMSAWLQYWTSAKLSIFYTHPSMPFCWRNIWMVPTDSVDTLYRFILRPLIGNLYALKGHSTITWTKFYPILTPSPLEWTVVDIVDILHHTFCYVTKRGLSTDPFPSSRLRSYWMTPKQEPFWRSSQKYLNTTLQQNKTNHFIFYLFQHKDDSRLDLCSIDNFKYNQRIPPSPSFRRF